MTDPMTLHYGVSCRPCIDRHVGPALQRIIEPRGRDYCGGCGKFTDKHFFAYWFPWPDEDPYDGYDPRDDPNHPDFQKEIE